MIILDTHIWVWWLDGSSQKNHLEAAKALIQWKSLFADEVAAQARRMLLESGRPGNVTLSHYRQAAQIALRSLSAAILDGGTSRDDQNAA